jgi:hypothetical protein
MHAALPARTTCPPSDTDARERLGLAPSTSPAGGILEAAGRLVKRCGGRVVLAGRLFVPPVASANGGWAKGGSDLTGVLGQSCVPHRREVGDD